MTRHRVKGETAVHLALLALAVRERRGEEELLERLRAGEPRLHSEFRVCLAWALRHTLRADAAVRSVDIIGSSVEDRARPSSDLDLVIHVASRDAAAQARWKRLDREVSAAYLALLKDVPAPFRLLDLHVVTDEDARDRRGFAAVLQGSQAPRYRMPG